MKAATPSGPVATDWTSVHAFFLPPAGRNWTSAGTPARGAPWEVTVELTAMGDPNTSAGTPAAVTSVEAGARDCA